MTKRLRIVVPIMAVALAATWLVVRGRQANGTAVHASGTVEATEADLGFQLPGRVDEIFHREGDAVTRGTVLARLDTRELEASRASATAQLDAASARLRELRRGARPEEVAQAEAAARSTRQRADEARSEAERARRLHEGGAISRQLLDQAETALQVSEAALDQAEQTLALVREGPRVETIQAQEALVAQARAQVSRAEAVLGNAIIHAPFDGVVTLRHREPGETVAPGAPVLTLLDPDDRWVRIYVPGDRIGRIAIGMEASITADTYPDRTYGGVVTFIGSEAEFTPRNVQTAEARTKLVYPVKIRITGDTAFELKPGIPADVVLLERAP
ncbi:MAG: HlyD family efflux transporter periplasmic adaptor subunit [Gemmatimonadota bacterium]|nr:HlyD family efflux transporter periplasmic adaptor subunit [Gemmatimonadota bacterium]